jgi:hypothetical protein
MEIDLKDPAAARAVVEAGLAHEMGRWPTPEEVSQAIEAYTRSI